MIVHGSAPFAVLAILLALRLAFLLYRLLNQEVSTRCQTLRRHVAAVAHCHIFILSACQPFPARPKAAAMWYVAKAAPYANAAMYSQRNAGQRQEPVSR